MHKLLSRQLRRLALNKPDQADTPPTPEEWRAFLEVVTQTYEEFDEEKKLIENTMELVSKELSERNEELNNNLDKLKSNQEKIQHQALHDGLTNLPNRRLFMDRLNHAIQYSANEDVMVAVLFIDLDYFKKINDSCGHHEGDQVLREVSSRVASCIRSHDTLARFGGDEFVVLLEGLKNLGIAHKICSRMLKSIMQPYKVQDNEFHLSASIGVSFFPNMANNGEQLVRQADMAMYNAKESGKNTVKYFNTDMEVVTLQGIAIEQKLRRAINAQEFSLVYQPKVCAQTKDILGFEALIRWCPPGEKAISPDEFIPLAERTGLITLIGQWVINETCSQIRRWIDQGLPLKPVAINLSTKELRSLTLVDDLKQSLAIHNIPASALEIEITETAVAENIESACNVLNQIRSLGIKIALDDFGTGYSSLSYLQKLPIQFLKIDKSFIFELQPGSRNSAIIGAIVALSHSMGFSVIAEGVEDEKTFQFLKEKNCDALQGYYFYQPKPSHQTTQLLKSMYSKPNDITRVN
jgi:diguanylate cyclase (GGDEF)-like protein